MKKETKKIIMIGSIAGLAIWGVAGFPTPDVTGKTLNIGNDNTVEDSTLIPYAYGVTASTGTVDDDGSKEDKEYTVELALSDINGTQTDLTLNVSTKLLFPDDYEMTADFLSPKTVGLAFASDIELKNGDDDDVKLIDFSDSTIGGEEGDVQVFYDQNNDEMVQIVLDVNPDSADLFNDLKDLEDTNDEKTITLTTGLNKNIKLVFKNE